jgi:hypothetical protein
MALYLAANAPKRRLGRTLAFRMGLRSDTAFWATVIEVGTLLFLGLVVGVGLAWLALRLLSGHLDPLPVAPPATALRFSAASVGICLLSIAGAVAVTAGLIQHRTRRDSLPNLLRDNG